MKRQLEKHGVFYLCTIVNCYWKMKGCAKNYADEVFGQL